MNRSLPVPLPNMDEYKKIVNRGFQRYPQRKENYEKYLRALENGYRAEYVDYLPIKMDYECSSRCNFRCKMCLLSDKDRERPKQMDLESFKKSLEEQVGLIEIKLQGMGEPLLNKDFFSMLEEAVKRDLWVRTATNASLLHLNENYKKLIDYKIGDVNVSIDGARKETFENIREGSDFETVVENAKRMNLYARSKGEIWRTSCWMLVQRDNQEEMFEMIDLAEYMNFSRLVFSLGISNWGDGDWEKKNNPKRVQFEVSEEKMWELVKKGKSRGIEVSFWLDYKRYSYPQILCNWPWERSFCSGDMRLVPCCNIMDGNIYSLGNALNIEHSWNGSEYKEFRRMHMEGRIPLVCRQCYDNWHKLDEL